jgi:hypothetical protein
MIEGKTLPKPSLIAPLPPSVHHLFRHNDEVGEIHPWAMGLWKQGLKIYLLCFTN